MIFGFVFIFDHSTLTRMWKLSDERDELSVFLISTISARTPTMDVLIQISKTYWPLSWITRITDSLFMLLERRVKWLLVFNFSPFHDHFSNHIWKFEEKKKEFLPKKMVEFNICAFMLMWKRKGKYTHTHTLAQWTQNHIRFVAFING